MAQGASSCHRGLPGLGGHAQVSDPQSLSFLRRWVGRVGCWSDRLVCVLGVVHVCVVVVVCVGKRATVRMPPHPQAGASC